MWGSSRADRGIEGGGAVGELHPAYALPRRIRRRRSSRSEAAPSHRRRHRKLFDAGMPTSWLAPDKAGSGFSPSSDTLTTAWPVARLLSRCRRCRHRPRRSSHEATRPRHWSRRYGVHRHRHGPARSTVRALAAKHPFVIARRQSLTRRWKMRNPVDQVDIDGAKVEDRHRKRQMKRAGLANCATFEIRAIFCPTRTFLRFMTESRTHGNQAPPLQDEARPYRGMPVRMSARLPEPKTELDYKNPTPCLSRSLSAQATDAGVNRATRSSMPLPTRRRRWWLWASKASLTTSVRSAVQHQGEERPQAVTDPDRRAWRRGAETARRSRLFRAWGERQQTWC